MRFCELAKKRLSERLVVGGNDATTSILMNFCCEKRWFGANSGALLIHHKAPWWLSYVELSIIKPNALQCIQFCLMYLVRLKKIIQTNNQRHMILSDPLCSSSCHLRSNYKASLCWWFSIESRCYVKSSRKLNNCSCLSKIAVIIIWVMLSFPTMLQKIGQ